jgi:hypothetical protein
VPHWLSHFCSCATNNPADSILQVHPQPAKLRGR